ncbi:MAG: hypothetical protein ACRDPE_23440 [Solirubrobacterales bacterium]
MPIGSDPQIVNEARNQPGTCLATGDTEGPFIDVGTRTMFRGPYNYISVAWFEDQATKLLGMIPKAVVVEEFAKLTDEIAEKDARIAELERLEDVVAAAESVVGQNS